MMPGSGHSSRQPGIPTGEGPVVVFTRAEALQVLYTVCSQSALGRKLLIREAALMSAVVGACATEPAHALPVLEAVLSDANGRVLRALRTQDTLSVCVAALQQLLLIEQSLTPGNPDGSRPLQGERPLVDSLASWTAAGLKAGAQCVRILSTSHDALVVLDELQHREGVWDGEGRVGFGLAGEPTHTAAVCASGGSCGMAGLPVLALSRALESLCIRLDERTLQATMVATARRATLAASRVSRRASAAFLGAAVAKRPPPSAAAASSLRAARADAESRVRVRLLAWPGAGTLHLAPDIVDVWWGAVTFLSQPPIPPGEAGASGGTDCRNAEAQQAAAGCGLPPCDHTDKRGHDGAVSTPLRAASARISAAGGSLMGGLSSTACARSAAAAGAAAERVAAWRRGLPEGAEAVLQCWAPAQADAAQARAWWAEVLEAAAAERRAPGEEADVAEAGVAEGGGVFLGLQHTPCTGAHRCAAAARELDGQVAGLREDGTARAAAPAVARIDEPASGAAQGASAPLDATVASTATAAAARQAAQVVRAAAEEVSSSVLKRCTARAALQAGAHGDA